REGWFRGKFERGRLDGAIDHLKDIAGSDRVHPRERQAFWNDIYALRDFRASRGQSNAGWGGWGGGRRWPDSRW
ncbi:MAG TPA: hypothetical protein DEH78_28785, partial [Solibacterales bacterium]|nr:hypothetical protein [Bryobacterales bacterium]